MAPQHDPTVRPRCASALAAAAVLLALLFVASCGSGSDPLAESQALYEQGQHEQAIEVLVQILDEDPGNAEANYLLGTIYVALRNPPMAVWPLRKAAESDDPIADQAGLLLANLFLATEDFEEAIRMADAILDGDPGRSAARITRAQANLQLKRWTEALSDTEILLQENPRDYTVLHTHTTALSELGRYDETEEYLEQLYQVALDDLSTKAPNMCISLASFLDEIREQRGRAKAKALECFEAHPDSRIVLEWAVWLHDASDEPEVADALLAKATDLAPHRLELWQMRSDRLMRQGESERAAEVLKTAAELLDTPGGWSVYADLLTALGESEAAILALERGIEVAGEDVSMTFVKADLLTTVGRNDEARALAETMDEPAYRNFILGRVAETEGDTLGALELIEAGLESWPNNAQARYNAGMLAQRLGRLQRALDHYREATRADAQATDAALRMAELLLITGQYEAANDLAIRHAQNRPWDSHLFLVAAEAALKADQPEQARNVYAEIIGERHGLKLESTMGLAWVERETVGPEAAAKVLAEAQLDWADPANGPALSALVGDLLAIDDMAGAQAELDTALAARPDDAGLHVMRGRLFLAASETEKAGAAFDRAAKLDPSLGSAITGRATIVALSGDRERAIALFDEAVAAGTPDWNAAYRAAQLTLELGRVPEATQRLREFLEVQPGMADAANDLAWLLAAQGEDLDYALELAQRAVRLAPSANSWDTLGAVQAARGVPKLAIRAFQRGLSEDPEAAGVRYRLALAQAADGRNADAVASLRTALEHGDFPELEQAKVRLAQLEQSAGSAE